MRTTVFLKGCPLRCAWCHNPEALSPSRQIWWLEDSCIACGECVDNCPNDALNLTETGMQIDRDLCQGCYACVDICPAKAMKALRKDWSVDALFDEVTRDAAFYKKGGGVTVSGGEPLTQWRIVRELLQRCQDHGIHTALDTCGEAPLKNLKEVLPYTRLVLFDLKIMDAELHAQWTGSENHQILSNLKYIVSEVERREDLELWIRTPLIPEATATAENITKIARFVRHEMSEAVSRWDLCTFNPLCENKYKQLGASWKFEGVPLMTHDEASHLRNLALQESGFTQDRLSISGRTR
jgi:pyruvate formate lyase activating enzyme